MTRAEHELRFLDEAMTLEMAERLADLAEVLVGSQVAPSLLLGAALKSLGRTLDTAGALAVTRVWLQSLQRSEQNPERFH